MADGRVWLKPNGVPSFAGDLPEAEQKLVWATHAAPTADLFNQKVEGTAWKTKPSWYIVATKDRTIQPDLERFVAKRMKATTFETESSHVPMLSQPDFVLDVIRKAAKAVMEKSESLVKAASRADDQLPAIAWVASTSSEPVVNHALEGDFL